jgi:putative FmdB family regulatory protein
MPIYEYKCDNCGNHYEQIRRMADADSALECPDCRSERVKRQLSSFATTSGGTSMAAAESPCGRPACGGGRCAFSD